MWFRYLLLSALAMPLLAVSSHSQNDAAQLRVGHIHIRVRDVERTKAFYRDQLGLQVTRERAGEMVEFEGGKLWFGKWDGPGELHTDSMHIGLGADSVEAAYQRLEQRGLEIPHPPEERPYGWSFTFQDPDGYVIEVEGEK